MLPKKEEQVGSMKRIGGSEVWTRRIHTPQMDQDGRVTGSAIWELVDGGYIYPNGEPVRDREALNMIPDQHRAEALAWWDRTFGAGAVADQSDQPGVADVMAENQRLKAQIAGLQSDASAGQMPGRELAEPGKDPEKEEIKSQVGKKKADRGTTVLGQMGINV